MQEEFIIRARNDEYDDMMYMELVMGGRVVSTVEFELLNDCYEYEFSLNMDRAFYDEMFGGDTIMKIRFLWVDRDVRRTGIGGMMLEEAMNVAVAFGVRCVFLNAAPLDDDGPNISSLVSFYVSHGLEYARCLGDSCMMWKRVMPCSTKKVCN